MAAAEAEIKMNKNKLVEFLLKLSVVAGVSIASYSVAGKMMGYSWQVGFLMANLSAGTLGALLHGLEMRKYKDMSEIIIGVALLMLIFSGSFALMPYSTKFAWIAAMIAIPFTAYSLGRLIKKRNSVRQSVS